MKKINKKIELYFENLNFKRFIIYSFFLQIFSIVVSYQNLFNYERCTNIINRKLFLFNNTFVLEYPEMCDESYYFHGFQWVHHIYQNGFVYQDRPLYLALGFLIYRSLFVVNKILNISFDPLSLLLLSTLIYQLIIVNLISYFLVKICNKSFNKFYFTIYFLIIVFSFEIRRYLFLPSSSNFYLLLFVTSIYLIKKNKLNGFIYGLMITISGYGIIGFLYQLIPYVLNFKKNYRVIINNILLLFIPSLFFELLRIAMGVLKGPGYGVKYIYNAEFYQQFIWIFNSLLSDNFVPSTTCQEINKFINCYIAETFYFLKIMSLPLTFVSFIAVIHFLKYRKNLKTELYYLLSYTVFSYFFILFQGIYSFRIVFYSLGFGLIIYLCFILKIFENNILSIFTALFFMIFNLSRSSWIEYSLKLNIFEILLLIFILSLLITNNLNLKKYN